MPYHFSRLILCVIAAFFFCLPSIHVRAQTTASTDNAAVSDRYVRVVMNDGSVKLGQWLSENADIIQLSTRNLGKINIPKYLIAQMMDLTASEYDRLGTSRATRNGRINPQSSRYFFAPSGIQLKRGEGYFQSNIALNSVSIGVTDNVTVGGLLSFVGAGGSLKIGKEVAENVHVSFGGIGFKDYVGELDRPVGLVFANITWGTEDRNLTVNIGTGTRISGVTEPLAWYASDSTNFGGSYVEYEYTITEYQEERIRPLLLNVSGMVQISDFKWLITENYFIQSMRSMSLVTDSPIVTYANPVFMGSSNYNGSNGVTILSVGVRNLSQRNGWLWDYGMVGVIGEDFGFGAPWVSATLPF
jgi:hypothetical protein